MGNDLVGLPYQGSTFLHKYPCWLARSHKGRAIYVLWKKDRLACVEAQQEGFFTTPVIKFKGRYLKVDVKTSKTCNIKVKVVGIKSWIHKKKVEELIPGRNFDNCNSIEGDYLSVVVTWKGNPDLGHNEDQPIFAF